MKIRKKQLSKDERLWIGKIIECYKINEAPNKSKILIELHDKLTQDIDYSRIDSGLFYRGELTIYGIYCFDQSNEFLRHIDNVLQCIKNEIKLKKDVPKTFTAIELSETLNIAESKVQACFKLISHTNHYFDGFQLEQVNCFGYPSATVGRLSDYLNNILDYKNIGSLLADFIKPTEIMTSEISDKELTPPVRKADLTHRLGISSKILSKKGSAWRKLFEKHENKETRRSRIPYIDLLPLIRQYGERKGYMDYPKTVKELKGKLKGL